MGVENVPVRQLIDRVLAGEIRIPAFQRGFVWTPEMVQFLMDSIYKGYPIGSLLLWRTRERLNADRALGPYILPEPSSDYPVDYVLDGQQRLTALFGVFQTSLPATEQVDWLDVYFDLAASETAQDSQFVALKREDVDSSRHFPLKVMFDSVAYRRATSNLDEASQVRVDNIQQVFKEAQIPVETVATEDRAKIAIIFERVNRTGVPLDTYQLLSAWTWSDDFDLRERFDELAEELEPFGFGAITQDQNLLLRSCAAVVSGNASSTTIITLSGAEVREKFALVQNGVKGAIDFLRRNCHVHSLEVLPYSAMIAPLACFFATDNDAGVHPSHEQALALRRWFWRSCFTRRYSSSVNRTLEHDINAALKLRHGELAEMENIPYSIDKDFFLKNSFALAAVNTKTFVLLLASASPRSLLSGVPVSLEEVLLTCNRTEFHHIFPKAYLRKQGVVSKDRQWRLANFCFLSQTDNRRIRSQGPGTYSKNISPELEQAILDSAMIPGGALALDYDAFLHARAALLVEKSLGLMR